MKFNTQPLAKHLERWQQDNGVIRLQHRGPKLSAEDIVVTALRVAERCTRNRKLRPLYRKLRQHLEAERTAAGLEPTID